MKKTGMFNLVKTCLFLPLAILVILLFTPIKLISQESNDTITKKHIVFLQPLGYLIYDYSIGYEYNPGKNISYSIIAEYYKPFIKASEDLDKISSLYIYEGFSIRPGIKFKKNPRTFSAVEILYKYSYYNDKLILRVDRDGEQHDSFYLESRNSNSFGIAYKFGYEFDYNRIYFCPFVVLGIRFRFDNVTIHSKYEGKSWGEEPYYLFDDTPEMRKYTWPIPMFRLGFLLGINI
jgi:hypothetical protein